MINLNNLEALVNSRSSNERVILFVGAIFFVALLWYLLIIGPMAEKRTAMKVEAVSLKAKVDVLTKEANAINILANSKRVTEQLREFNKVKADLAQINGKLSTISQQVIPAQQIQEAIRDIIGDTGQLTLIGVKNLTNEEFILPIENKSPVRVRIYKHLMQLDLKGEYFSTVAYLKKLELLHWHLLWDGLEYHVEAYPLASITLRVFLLTNTQEL